MRRFGLIGNPLSHSFSRNYFQEKFTREHLTDCDYDLFPLASIDELPELLASYPDLCGLNVTVPFKERILPFLQHIDPIAQSIGAVNCVRIESNGALTGYNTDVIGFEQSILPFLENNYERALILGTGGSSKAVAWVLQRRGIEVWYASRSDKGERTLGYDQLDQYALAHFKLIINCTPLGTFPDIHTKPSLPYDGLTTSHLLYDLVYNPAETAFLQEAKSRGAATMNGLRMLEIQAEESWSRWS